MDVDPHHDEQALGRPEQDLPEWAALRRAERFNEADRHDLALQAAQEGLQINPGCIPLRVEVGRTLHLLDRYEDAEEELRGVLALQPDHYAARVHLAWVLMELGKNVECEALLLEVLRDDPEDPQGLHAYAALLMRANQLDKADRVARRALALDPESVQLHQLLTFINARASKRGASLHHAEAGLRLEPGDYRSHLAASVAAYENGKPLRAREHLRQVLRLDADPELQEQFELVDRMTRWPMIPFYYFSLWIDRLPGKQITLWIAFVLLYRGGRAAGIPIEVLLPVSLTYLALVIYTWLAIPFSRLWVKVFPPR